MSAKVKKMGSSWFTNKKATLLSVLTIAGWSLLLGPQLQAKVEVAKQYCARQYHLWQSPVTDDGVIEIIGDGIPACEHPGYLPRIISYDPFIMHIENFVSEAERAYLIELGMPQAVRSEVMQDNGTSRLDNMRTSHTAFLGKSDPVIQCVLERAAQLQGFYPIDSIEDLQLTAYTTGQQYHPHYDWFMEHLVPIMGHQNRGSTFFVTLDADCENCGTQFPRVAMDWRGRDKRWCDLVECENNDAVTIKAKPGSAVYWQNLDADGYGNPKTLHAGLPVPEGKKIGMNIWTRVATPWSMKAAGASLTY